MAWGRAEQGCGPQGHRFWNVREGPWVTGAAFLPMAPLPHPGVRRTACHLGGPSAELTSLGSRVGGGPRTHCPCRHPSLSSALWGTPWHLSAPALHGALLPVCWMREATGAPWGLLSPTHRVLSKLPRERWFQTTVGSVGLTNVWAFVGLHSLETLICAQVGFGAILRCEK